MSVEHCHSWNGSRSHSPDPDPQTTYDSPQRVFPTKAGRLQFSNGTCRAHGSNTSSGAPLDPTCCPIYGPWSAYFLASAVSMAAVSSAESGATPESNRFSTDPSRPIRNLPKFHFTSPGNAALGPVNAA
jgi:hypothetical protein